MPDRTLLLLLCSAALLSASAGIFGRPAAVKPEAILHLHFRLNCTPMVLSNKKLKQKIRSLLAESVAAAESGKPPGDAAAAADVKQQLQSLKGIMSSKNHRRPRPTRRAGKRKKPSSAEDAQPAGAGVEEQEVGGDSGGSVDLSSKKKKKRKRRKEEEEVEEGEGAAESTGPKQQKERREEEHGEGRRKKEKKKRKKKKEGEGNEEGVKTGNEDWRINGGRNEKKTTTETSAIDASEEHSDARRKVYVGGIPYYSTEDDIRSFFEGCGTVTEMDCMAFPESGKFRGIAILTFRTEAAAKRALALDGADMGGLYLKIQPYKAMRTQMTDFSPEVVSGYNRIYVGNLSWDIAEDDLRKLFLECKISSIRFGEDKATGEFKGYAHVDFEDSRSLEVALKLDQMVVCGRPVRIRCAVPKKGSETKLNAKPASKNDDGNASSGGAKGKSSVDGNASSGGAKKKKRQTCYECGLPGHLSSSCPKKKPVEAASGSSSR